MDIILTEEKALGKPRNLRWLAKHRRILMSTGVDIGPLHLMKTAEVPPAPAYLNHGRWVVDCPFGCGNAEYANEDGVFFCTYCQNGEVDRQFVPVIFPKARKAIETEVLKRKYAKNRNWYPKETVKNLIAENKKHHVGEE